MPHLSAIAKLQLSLKLQFKDEFILQTALRHKSACVNKNELNNERLEFLGDAVIGMVVSDYLFKQFPSDPEGKLAKAKAFLVCESTLAEAAILLGLEKYVEMSSAEEATGGRGRKSILSDAFEAVIGAIYLDIGVRSASRVVRNALVPAMKQVGTANYHGDYKSALQERTQSTHRRIPQYEIVDERGADHVKQFVAEVTVGNEVMGSGIGNTKKEAEQAAAEAALRILKGKT